MPDEPLVEIPKSVPEAAPAVVDMLESVKPAEAAPQPEVLPSLETVSKESEPVTEEAEPLPPTDAPVAPTPAAHATAAALHKDHFLTDIETVMQEDLKELYKQLPPARQHAFKTRGEEVAQAIRTLASAAKINAKKIFQLLFGWLKMLPGVNRFFLEQEAKIKTDKILLAADEERRRGTIS